MAVFLDGKCPPRIFLKIVALDVASSREAWAVLVGVGENGVVVGIGGGGATGDVGESEVFRYRSGQCHGVRRSRRRLPYA